MSKIFYDHLIALGRVDKEIKANDLSKEEKEELWGLVDEIVHHRIMGCILDRLPAKFHEDFLERFHTHPEGEDLLYYINEKINEKIEEVIKKEITLLTGELLEEIRGKKK